MKISYSWLKEYIDFDLSPEELSEKLTLAGLEVENLEKEGSGVLLEVNITPNRADCLSFIGIAREISALTGCPVKQTDFKIKEDGPDIKSVTSVDIQDENLCPRYSARVIQGVKVGPSPKWLEEKLSSIGVRSINNVVDITNFVLQETGHPLHAFDYDQLKENKIIVRRSSRGEKFTALDNTICNLKEDMLVIADGKRPVALAGVIGGKDTEVSDKTTNILLESAYFEPSQIRRTSKRLGIQTESSYRFERGADPENVVKASDRAAALILELAGGKVAKGIIDAYPRPISNPAVMLRLDRVNKIAGKNLSEKEVTGFMEKLGFSVSKKEDGLLNVQPTSYRRDMTREIDLIEEIVRLHGYNNIEAKSPKSRIGSVNINKHYAFVKEVKNYFKGKGFCEAINYSFISDEMQKMFSVGSEKSEADDVVIRNPISNEWRIMRNSLLPGLLLSLQKNAHRGIEDIQLFELGRKYKPWGSLTAPSSKNGEEQKQKCFSEETHLLAGIITSKTEKKIWGEEGKGRDIYYLKGIIEIFLESARLSEYHFKKSSLPDFDNLIEIYNGDHKIGIIGELSRRVTQKLDINNTLLVFEINLDSLYKTREKAASFHSISKYPNILRDLAVLADRKIHSKEIGDFIKQKGAPLLKDVTLFDCYEGKSIPPGKKSLAYSLVFGDKGRTLKDDEVDAIHDNIVKGLAEKFDAHLRPQ